MVRDNKDYEGRMAKVQLDKIETYAKKINSIIHDQDDLEEWVQEKLTLATAYLADIKFYMDTELAKAGQSLHRDDIDDLLRKEYEAYQDLKRTHSPEAYERVGAIHQRIADYEMEEKQKTGLQDFTVETQTDKRHIKAHDLKEAKKLAEEQVKKDSIKNKVVSVYRKGGGIEEETMWRVQPSTLADDMKEAREIIGEEKWKSMSRAEQVKETKYLKFRGEVGFPGQEEDIETISAMQYYEKGGKIRGEYEQFLLDNGFELGWEMYGSLKNYRKNRWFCHIDKDKNKVFCGKYYDDYGYEERGGPREAWSPSYDSKIHTNNFPSFKKFILEHTDSNIDYALKHYEEYKY